MLSADELGSPRAIATGVKAVLGGSSKPHCPHIAVIATTPVLTLWNYVPGLDPTLRITWLCQDPGLGAQLDRTFISWAAKSSPQMLLFGQGFRKSAWSLWAGESAPELMPASVKWPIWNSPVGHWRTCDLRKTVSLRCSGGTLPPCYLFSPWRFKDIPQPI